MIWIAVIIPMLPILSCFIVIKGMSYYGELNGSPKNISPSYFAAVALLFALFASLIFSEVWSRIGKINSLMLDQANSLRGILRMTENDSSTSVVYQKAVQDYISTIDMKESGLEINNDVSTNSNHLFQPLYKLVTDKQLFQDKANVQMEVLKKTEQLRTAWFEREELLKQRLIPQKILILFLMGFFTQISIAMSHLGNKKAIRDTVLVFSLAFFSALAILIFIDDTALSKQFLSIHVLKDVH